MALRLFRLGAFAVRRRVGVLVAWLLVLLAAGVGAVTLSGPTSDAFEIPGQESTTALDLISERFGDAGGASAQVVLEAPDGRVTDPAVARQVAGVVQRLGALPGVAGASNPLDPQAPTVSPDQRAAYSTVTYAEPAAEITQAEREALLEVVDETGSTGLTAAVTGEAVLEPTHVGGPAEVVGVVVALVVLVLTYGTLVAAGMNLLTAIVGVGIGAAAVTALTGVVELQSKTPILAVMLGLAVGIDYALFIVTRYRAELRAGRAVPEAVAMAVGTAGSAVLAAGLTVVIALAGLAVVGIPFLTEMGLAAAATVVIAVLVALTLVPAALGLLGHRVLPRRERRGGGGRRTDRGFFRGWARTVTTRRWASLLTAVVALAVVAVPFASMRTTLEQRPAEGSTQERAEAILDARFGPGVSGPLLVLVDGEGAAQRAAQVVEQAQALPEVALVTPPRPSPDGSAALVTVVPASASDSEETVQLVEDLRDELAGGTPRAYVTGQTAVSVDVSQTLEDALPVYLALVVGLAVVLLVLVFRSLLVPLAGVLGFLLTVGASLGATTAVFQWGWLADVVQVQSAGPLLSLMPILVIGILFGLAMDYQVFLVARMHEAHARGAQPREAVVTGFRQAAPVVVAAAAIMFSVFAGFVPSGDATIKSIAFALAIGILVDALVVRMVVMPAALALMGGRAWWLPRWLRWLPVLDVEGSALERGAPERRPVAVRA